MTEGRTQIILWRHGQTTFNVENRFQGHLDAPLNDVGLAQAEVAAVGLSKLRIDAIYASPLQRAYITAQVLAGRVDLPIATDDRLKEIDVGEWEGLYAEDIYRANPEFVLALGEGRDARRSPTGETATEVAARMAEALREIASAHLGQTVVVASHGLAIRMGTAGVLGWDYPTSTTLASMSNCGWTMLAARPDSYWKLVTWNQRAEQLLH